MAQATAPAIEKVNRNIRRADAWYQRKENQRGRQEDRTLRRYDRRVAKADTPLLVDGGKRGYSAMTPELAAEKRNNRLAHINQKAYKNEQRYSRKLLSA